MDWETARLRVKAKRFRDSIPVNMASPLPDELIDSLSDDEVPKFFEILRSLRLRQKETYHGYGHWERI